MLRSAVLLVVVLTVLVDPRGSRALRPQPDAPACRVVVAPASSSVVGQSVISSAALSWEPTDPQYAANLGYHVDTRQYDRSASLTGTVHFDVRADEARCGWVEVELRPVLGEGNVGDVVSTRRMPVEEGRGTLDFVALVSGLPPGALAVDDGFCLASQLVVRDAAGTVVQRAPATHPAADCPGSGGMTYGG